jgi:hypothetical protein
MLHNFLSSKMSLRPQFFLNRAKTHNIFTCRYLQAFRGEIRAKKASFYEDFFSYFHICILVAAKHIQSNPI